MPPSFLLPKSALHKSWQYIEGTLYVDMQLIYVNMQDAEYVNWYSRKIMFYATYVELQLYIFVNMQLMDIYMQVIM
jgi:hypothetical protein